MLLIHNTTYQATEGTLSPGPNQDYEEGTRSFRQQKQVLGRRNVNKRYHLTTADYEHEVHGHLEYIPLFLLSRRNNTHVFKALVSK